MAFRTVPTPEFFRCNGQMTTSTPESVCKWLRYKNQVKMPARVHVIIFSTPYLALQPQVSLQQNFLQIRQPMPAKTPMIMAFMRSFFITCLMLII